MDSIAIHSFHGFGNSLDMATLAIVSCRFNYLELAKKFLLSTIAENLTFELAKKFLLSTIAENLTFSYIKLSIITTV